MSLDQLIQEFDHSLRTISGVMQARRPRPLPESDHQRSGATPGADGAQHAEPEALSEEEKRHAAGLMRVNHVGEICAQALYQSQKMATSSAPLKARFAQAASEEIDHLSWTAERLSELDARPSLLNPLWYAGALTMGFVAGRFGDRASLGFMAETERQVGQHLAGHLERLPAADQRSRAIVEQMRQEETAHAHAAVDAGGVELPAPVKGLMKAFAKVMTHTAYRI